MLIRIVVLLLLCFASPSYAQEIRLVGLASWYGPGFHGRKTASGETYNMYGISAAHKTLPLGTRVLVINKHNGKKIVVRINDRGPYIGARILDLSKGAALRLNITGVSLVELIVLRKDLNEKDFAQEN